MSSSNPVETENFSIRRLLSITIWSTRLVFGIMPLSISTSLFLDVLVKLKPLIYSFLLAQVIDGLVNISQSDNLGIEAITPYVIALFAYTVVGTIINNAKMYLNNIIFAKMNPTIRQKLYSQAYKLGIQNLEDPEVSDKLHRAGDSLYQIMQFVRQIFKLVADVVALVTTGLIVLNTIPIIIPILLVTIIPKALVNKHFIRKNWELIRNNTEYRRKAFASAGILTDPSQLQEVYINQAFGFLDRKYREYSSWIIKAKNQIFRKWGSILSIAETIDDAAVFGGIFLLFKLFLDGVLTIGDVTFNITALQGFNVGIERISNGFVQIYEQGVRLDDTSHVFMLKPAVKDGNLELPTFTTPPEIEITNLRFKYPKSDQEVIKGLNLNLKPGEKIAIVGENGAGKTTLVKLISRIYSATEGQITVSGHNLDAVKIDSWYENLGVLFQDFNQYGQLTVSENIHIGRPTQEITEKSIELAANKADALSFINKLPLGFDQYLRPEYKDGVRLSGGQWQKLAIARFFYRNSPVLIFDEPTAVIDAEAEFRIFNQIYKFFENRTVIIISHRFSTVRNADRIIVLKDGQIAEQGSHDELIDLDGNYARAFKLQADGYKL